MLKQRTILLALALFGVLLLGGCATLKVTPAQTLPTDAVAQPVKVGVQLAGDRLRDAVSEPSGSVITAASGTLFRDVVLLAPETRSQTPQEIQATQGVDYILSVNISDVMVNGNLNPIWFASLPLLFFKPYAPIVTFEATVTLESSLVDAHSGTVVMQREITETATDHFSPVNPGEKVRTLISRGINNAIVQLLDESRRKVAGQKPPA